MTANAPELNIIHEITDCQLDPYSAMGLLLKTDLDHQLIRLYWVSKWGQEIEIGVIHYDATTSARSVYSYQLYLISWALSVRERIQRKLDTTLTAWAFGDALKNHNHQQVPTAII